MSRCLIITGGTIDISFALRHLHLRPDEVVGDFDTVEGGLLREYQSHPEIHFEVHQPEKDETDTELALLSAARAGCSEADILGALGGRMDHAIGNIQLLYQFFLQGMEISIYDAQNRIYLIGGRRVFRKSELYGKYISFLPLTETVEGLTLRGFKYPLNRKTISLGTSLCISNELKKEEGVLELENGVLICVESHD